MTTNELNEAEIINTLQLAYRWGYPLMAMAMNNKNTYASTTNAFYHRRPRQTRNPSETGALTRRRSIRRARST